MNGLRINCMCDGEVIDAVLMSKSFSTLNNEPEEFDLTEDNLQKPFVYEATTVSWEVNPNRRGSF